jgi:peptidyl-prolyl cis-trans isomerase-like protein 2
MGKNQHSKDRLFITSTEWATEYGGKRKRSSNNDLRPLPFDHCALSLSPFHNPVLLSNKTGVVFDFENIVPFLQKHHCCPVTSDPMTAKDIIRLNMSKNNEGDWEW